MNALELLRHPDSLADRPVYAVFGDDPFLRREALAAIARVVLAGAEDDLAVARFAGDQVTLADVLDEVSTLPFFSKRRVVVVDGADPFVTAHRKELEEYVERPAASGVLVLSVKSWPANTKLAKGVEKSGQSIECKGPHAREIVPWLTQFTKARFEARLDDDAARLLLELVGPEVGLLVSEVEKLSVYVGERRKIHREDVARLVGAGRIETVWKALEAATTGSGELALELVDRLIAAGEHPVGLLAAMTASLLKLHHAGRLRRVRVELKDACREAGFPPFAAESVGRQHAHLGPARVDSLPTLLLQADLDLKGSSTLLPRVVIEKLLVALARPRAD